MKKSLYRMRRDMRWDDNVALFHALQESQEVIPLFIFDPNILFHLPEDDHRVTFLHDTLVALREQIAENGGVLHVAYGDPQTVIQDYITKHNIETIYINHDYEPSAIARDQQVTQIAQDASCIVKTYKDQVIYEKNDILKKDNTPYTIYTPYKNKWLAQFEQDEQITYDTTSRTEKITTISCTMPSLEEIGCSRSSIAVKQYDLSQVATYDQTRDFPDQDTTSYLGVYLRFGLVSPRKLAYRATSKNDVFLSELIRREFFMQILYHFPRVVDANFKPKYNNIQWRNNPEDFARRCTGQTGYPIVDAGMRQLNQTGYMHNRVRMVVASFLCKHLLIHRRQGERYFAQKLFDYDLSANVGNRQRAAGTGCDAAPYFRVFNPYTQTQKFDPDLAYIKKRIPDYDPLSYLPPMVDHKQARLRALEVYKEGINNYNDSHTG